MAPDHIEELALIRMSQMQRETLERWAVICATAGEYEHAEQLAELARSDRAELTKEAA
jgi:hypothetical protein